MHGFTHDLPANAGKMMPMRPPTDAAAPAN
jgi:hypothetical protein